MKGMQKRVCMIVYAFYESDTRVMQYAKALVERGDVVDVLALRRDERPLFEIIDGVNVFRIQSRKVDERGRLAHLVRILRFLVVAAVWVTKKHLGKAYDVVHVHSVPDFLVFAAIVPKLLGSRVILDIHDILPEFYASKFNVPLDSPLVRLLLLIERVSGRFADHVIVANHLWRERLIARSLAPEKCSAIINYPDSQIFRPQPKANKEAGFRITYPGSLNTHQGLDIAVKAFAGVVDKMPGAEFHLYGEGPAKDSLIQLTLQLGLQERICFHEFLPTSEVAKIMAASDLAVVPKRASSTFGNEAASTKIMEFMLLGVPVIVSRTAIDSYYHDDSTVRFFESENVSDLAASMLQLWREPTLRAQLAANAHEYIRKNDWSEKKFDYLRLVDGTEVGEAHGPELSDPVWTSGMTNRQENR